MLQHSKSCMPSLMLMLQIISVHFMTCMLRKFTPNGGMFTATVCTSNFTSKEFVQSLFPFQEVPCSITIKSPDGIRPDRQVTEKPKELASYLFCEHFVIEPLGKLE